MQMGFDFGSGDIRRWHAALVAHFGRLGAVDRRPPIGQLIKSMIGGRTRDPISAAAYDRLRGAYADDFAAMSRATPGAIEVLIADVTFADAKAVNVVETLRIVGLHQPDFDLGFLADLSLDAALAWLERLPGVGRKVAASTLNASTLARPVFIADSHIVRVVQRLGFIGANGDYRTASEAVTAAMPAWSAHDFLEFHVVAKELGQQLCRPETPGCARCPLKADCSAPHG